MFCIILAAAIPAVTADLISHIPPPQRYFLPAYQPSQSFPAKIPQDTATEARLQAGQTTSIGHSNSSVLALSCSMNSHTIP